MEMVSLINIEPSMPRIAARQKHQQNADSYTPFNYYTKNMCLESLDHLINGIDVRFDKCGKTILMMQILIPSVTAESDVTNDDIAKI